MHHVDHTTHPDSAFPDSALPDSALPGSALPGSALPDSALPDDDLLLAEARQAASHAYAPYSGWHVGAAAAFADGRGLVHRGANVENGSYGLTICAERSAIFAAATAGLRRLDRIALTCRDAGGNLVAKIAPCGACLQVIAEFGTPDTRIVIDGRGVFRLGDFLPRPFAAETLRGSRVE